MAAPSPLFAVGRGVGQLLAEVRRLGGPRQGCSEPLLVALVARYSTPGPAGDPSARDISRDPSVVCSGGDDSPPRDCRGARLRPSSWGTHERTLFRARP